MTSTPRPPDDTGDAGVFEYNAGADGQPVRTIVEAVARVTDAEVRELDPLQHWIDTDVLTDLFGPSAGEDFYRSSSDRPRVGPCLTFEYEGCTVTVTPEQVRIDGA